MVPSPDAVTILLRQASERTRVRGRRHHMGAVAAHLTLDHPRIPPSLAVRVLARPPFPPFARSRGGQTCTDRGNETPQCTSCDHTTQSRRACQLRRPCLATSVSHCGSKRCRRAPLRRSARIETAARQDRTPHPRCARTLSDRARYARRRVSRARARACSNAAHMTHADRSETDIHCSPRIQSQIIIMPSCDAETSLVESPAQ